MSHRTAVALVSVSSVLWATLGTAAALVPEVPPTTIGASTLGLGGLLLLVMFPRRARAMLRGPSRRWVLIGAGAVVVYAFAFYTSMRVAGVAVGTVLNIGSAPVFTALLEFVIDRRRPGRAWCLGSAVGIAGLVSLTFSVHRPGVGGLPAAGIGLALVAGFLYALYAYCSGRVIAQRGDPAGAMGPPSSARPGSC